MEKVVGWAGRYVLPVLLLAGAFHGSRRLVASRPEAVRQQARARVLPVEVVLPAITNHTVIVEAMGQVVPANRIEVRAQVGGRVVHMHADFEMGGRLPAHARLAEIERDDYEAALVEAESAYAQASLAETVELQRQAIAREELQQEGSELPAGPGRAVALREPQVEAARRGRAAAAAAVERARRNLERTQISVPFYAVVLHKSTDEGSVLAPHAVLGEVAALDRFHVAAVLPPQSLGWLAPPNADGVFAGRPEVAVGVVRGAETVWRVGYLSRLAADMRGNMARLVIVVEHPLASDTAPLLLGAFVPLRIPGLTLDEVLSIPRRALREDGSVLLADADDRLEVRFPEVLRTTPEVALIGHGLHAGDRVITTAVSAAAPQMPLQILEGGAER